MILIVRHANCRRAFLFMSHLGSFISSEMTRRHFGPGLVIRPVSANEHFDNGSLLTDRGYWLLRMESVDDGVESP